MDVNREEDADAKETWLVAGVEVVSVEPSVGRDFGTGNKFCCWYSVFVTWFGVGWDSGTGHGFSE